jgi:alkylation response protein AidB-like acyl-CoA dehydrogenase
MEELSKLTEFLRNRAHDYELSAEWPEESLAHFTRCSGWRWGVPQSYGGAGSTIRERLRGYIALARGDMSTALFVTQHEGAVDLIAKSGGEDMCATWLPRFAAGEALTTIGYSQLTTSRQGGAPAMRAQSDGDGFRLDGVMPWVTGAPYVTNVACGATLEDGRQLLALVDMSAPGIRIDEPSVLAALNSTYTCAVHCDAVRVQASDVIAGPVAQVLSARSSLRLLLVSATGIGLAQGILDEIARLQSNRPSQISLDRADEAVAKLESHLDSLGTEEVVEQRVIDALRIRVNQLLVRLGGVLMVVAKGSGYQRKSTAQRLAAEAMFFCVWSASSGVCEQTVDHLLDFDA